MKKVTQIAVKMLFLELFSPRKFSNISSFPTTLKPFAPQKAAGQQQSVLFLTNTNAINQIVTPSSMFTRMYGLTRIIMNYFMHRQPEVYTISVSSISFAYDNTLHKSQHSWRYCGVGCIKAVDHL